jgi:hypothetical protein
MKTLTTGSIILSKHLELNTAKMVCMKKYFFLLAILALVSCRKNSDNNSAKNPEKFLLTGKFVDDITGVPVRGSGKIHVEGNTWGNDVWFSTSFEDELGNGIIDCDGSFSVSFEPRGCDHYMFWIWQTTNTDYYYPDFTIKRSEFTVGKKDAIIRLPRLATLNINFHNTSPSDKNDRLSISAYPVNSSLPLNFDNQWQNLQNCEIKYSMVYGGANAQGTLRAVVASDRVAEIYWDVIKNGTERSFKDTVFCSRNTVTNYQINY